MPSTAVSVSLPEDGVLNVSPFPCGAWAEITAAAVATTIATTNDVRGFMNVPRSLSHFHSRSSGRACELEYRKRDHFRSVHQVGNIAVFVGLVRQVEDAGTVGHAVRHARDPGEVLLIVSAGAGDEAAAPPE